jgi:hypothetical protein
VIDFSEEKELLPERFFTSFEMHSPEDHTPEINVQSKVFSSRDDINSFNI